ncbi:hypothetical protein FOZ63_024406, partial [Perkinsus olseni]
PALDNCKMSSELSDAIEGNTCLAAHMTASCAKRENKDVVVYVVGDDWKSTRYNSRIIGRERGKRFGTLKLPGDIPVNTRDLTEKLNSVDLHELDSSKGNFMWGIDIFYGSSEVDKVYVNPTAKGMKGFCRVNDASSSGDRKVHVYPVGRALFVR